MQIYAWRAKGDVAFRHRSIVRSVSYVAPQDKQDTNEQQ